MQRIARFPSLESAEVNGGTIQKAGVLKEVEGSAGNKVKHV